MGTTNPELIKNLKKGDKKTFEGIFNSYFDKLFYFAKDYVLDDEVAREFVQETFLRLWEIRNSISDDTNIQALLYTITRNALLNYLKRVTARNRYAMVNQQAYHELLLNYIALKDETSEQLFYEELQVKINGTIASLPPKCKEVFELSRFEGLKYKEIADKLGISVKTVENQISEALKRIRQEISEYL